jgi:LmbE family N-acetylglucosaminyl deacetylase
VATAVFFHAHPDDETITTGGTMARMSAEGHRVVLVTATAGELGEVPDGMLAPGEDLAELRGRELAAACKVLGVARHVVLGYGDSGMAGEPTNHAEGSFWRADPDEAAVALARVLREEEAQVLTAYDENGGYGHPDHVQVHRVGVRAGELAGTERVFLATINRDYILRLVDQAADFGMEPPQDGPDFSTLGMPEQRITTAVDVRPFLAAKRRAMEAHASQIAETSFFLAAPPKAFEAMWGTEWYIHHGAPAGGTLEDSLLAGGGGS